MASCDCREHRKQAITYELDLGNSDIGNFSELITAIMERVMNIELDILRGVLEKRDKEILAERDKVRFRCKGFQKTSVRTGMGILNLSRRVYVDRNITEGGHCVCLLDKDIHIEEIGLTEKALCEEAEEVTCMTSCRNAAEIFTGKLSALVGVSGARIILLCFLAASQRLDGRPVRAIVAASRTGTVGAGRYGKLPERRASGQCHCHATLPHEIWLKRLTAYHSFIDSQL